MSSVAWSRVKFTNRAKLFTASITLPPRMHDTGWIKGSVHVNVQQKFKTDNNDLVLCLGDQQHVLRVKKSHQSTTDLVTGR